MRYVIYTDTDQKWRWRLTFKGKKGTIIIATSHQGHPTQARCEKEISIIKENSQDADVFLKDDLTGKISKIT